MPLEAVLDQPPCLSDQHGRLCDLLSSSFAPGVGLVGQLVHIIADSRQFPKQGGVFIRRTGAKIHPQDQLPEQRLHFQSCGLRLFSQVSILTGVQAQGDRLKGLHRLIPLFHYFFVVIFQNELMGNFLLETYLKLREHLRTGVLGAEPLNRGILLSKFHAGADSGATGAAVYRVGAHFRLWSLLCVGLLAGASLRPS